MANLNETATWEPGIFQIETTTPALGGPEGPVNTAPRQLANRTRYLKQQTDALNTEIAAAKGSASSIDARFLAVEKTSAMGNFNFGSTSGATVAHGIGHTNYSVYVTSNEQTNGDLGDVYVDKSNNSFTVYNSGGFTGSGRYQITH
jgi:hypothetical protein